jgi:tetratricopeptide (TPR) repeat protein
MFLLALFSKEMAIIFPLVLLCYDYLFKKMPKDIFAHLKTYYLGYIGILLFYIFIRFILMANADKPMLALPMANLYTRTLTMPKVILTYIQWMLFPVNVHPTLPDDPSLFSHSLFEPGVLISISAIVALLVIAVRLRKKSPLFSFAVLWFFIALIPVSNIFYPLTNYIASRYLYLPVVGFCLLLAVFVSRLPDVRVISTILLIFYAIFTVIANMGWKNNVTFWSGMVENYPDNALAHSSLASSFRKSGLLDKAISEYKAALSLDPNYAKDYNNLGECFYQKGMFAEAMQELKKALELDPGLISAYINLGSVFGDKGSYPQAIKYFEKAIQLDRGSLNAYNGLGVTYARMKKYDLARKAWEKALEIGPDNKAVQENLRKLRELGI